MVPQWDFLQKVPTPNLPRPWQVHNHCLALSDRRGISGGKVSQWEMYRCMREKYGADEFSYMPESFVLPRSVLDREGTPWIVKLCWETGSRC